MEQTADQGMGQELDQGMMMNLLDWAYGKAVNGVPGLASAEEMAGAYIVGSGSLYDRTNSLIRWQNAKAGASGFLTGLGGIITLPVAVPANISSVIYVQMRMIAAIAYLGGCDLKNDRVRTLVYLCLTGNAVKEILKDMGIVVGTKLTTTAIKSISGKALTVINQKVGFRLLTKFGEKGAINLGKAIPLIGGIIGGTFDTVSTNTVGNVARDTFITLHTV